MREELHELVGIGLRHPHYHEILAKSQQVSWLELHTENFANRGGAPRRLLTTLRETYPLSLHGVGLSLGSSTGLNLEHLQAVKELIDFVDPFLVSEHLSWSSYQDTFIPDLLPVIYNQTSLKQICSHVSRAQEFFKRQLLLENPSSYLEYADSHYHEVDFLISICKITGAKILLDVNNVFVSSVNHGWNPIEYINQIPTNMVGEIHLAGHSKKILSSGRTILVDTHDNHVVMPVWQLYKQAIQRFGIKPTLLEWDANIPSLATLIMEANKAIPYLEDIHAYA